jgi:hypothetical protein
MSPDMQRIMTSSASSSYLTLSGVVMRKLNLDETAAI